VAATTVVVSTPAETAGQRRLQRVPSATTEIDVTALGSVTVAVRLDPLCVILTAWPLAALLELTTLAPLGSAICEAWTVATVCVAA
jgi:hypothetical protein